jgi:hypothetical protein
VEYLADIFPDAELLVSLEPEELAPTMLRIAKQHIQNGIFAPNNISKFPQGINPRAAYPSHTH